MKTLLLIAGGERVFMDACPAAFSFRFQEHSVRRLSAGSAPLAPPLPPFSPPSLDNRPIFDPYRRVDLAPDAHPLLDRGTRTWPSIDERWRTLPNIDEESRTRLSSKMSGYVHIYVYIYIYRMILEMISRKRTWKIFARDDVSCKKFIEKDIPVLSISDESLEVEFELIICEKLG